MKNYRFTPILLALLAVGLVVAGMTVKALGDIVQHAQGAKQQQPATQTATINGNFSGQVTLNGVATGVYSDSLTLPTGQPALGSVDLALQLGQSGNALTGYVTLDKSLIFTVEHTLTGQTPLAIGPYVNGTFDGNTIVLQSERVGLVMGGQRLTRQFRLIGTIDPDGTTLRGEYRETLWGYGRQPLTTIGSFTFAQPNYSGAVNPPSANPTPIPPLPTPNPASSGGTIYLPLVQR